MAKEVYLLYRERDGEVAILSIELSGQGNLEVENRGFGPYDHKPTIEVIERVDRSGCRLPTYFELVSAGVTPVNADDLKHVQKRAQDTTKNILRDLTKDC